MIAVVTMKIIVPHMVNRWESLRLGLLNSPEVNTSFTSTEAAIDAFSPAPTVRFALFCAFFAFSKKYCALFLCIMSSIVPTMTSRTIKTIYPCIIAGDINAESSAKGLLVNIRFSSKIFDAKLSLNRLAVEYRKSYPPQKFFTLRTYHHYLTYNPNKNW